MNVAIPISALLLMHILSSNAFIVPAFRQGVVDFSGKAEMGPRNSGRPAACTYVCVSFETTGVARAKLRCEPKWMLDVKSYSSPPISIVI